MDLKEKASYIMGLLEGSKMDFSDEQKKLLKSVVTVLQEMAEKIVELEKKVEEESALIDEIDEDLANVEEDIYKGRKSFGCIGNHVNCYHEGLEDEDDNERFEDYDTKEGKYEVSCSNCNRVIELGEEIFEKEEIICPECGARIDFNFKGQSRME